MTTPFSLYLDRETGLHRLHPLTKLVLALFYLVAGIAAPGVWGSYAVFLLLLPPALWGRITRPLLLAAGKAVLPFAVSLFQVQGFFWPGGTPILTLGPFSLKEEGLVFAIRSTGRILALVGSFLLLTLSTRPDRLMQALGERGTPQALTYILLTTLQIVPRFQEKARTILDAQRSRGLETEGNPWQRVRALLPLIQPLILGSIVDIEERAIALEVRAFGRSGPKTNLVALADSRGQQLARWLLLFGAVAAVGARLFLAVTGP